MSPATRFPLIRPALTPAEAEAVRLIADDRLDDEIAARLRQPVEAVRAQIAALRRRLGVHTRTQVYLRARELGAI